MKALSTSDSSSTPFSFRRLVNFSECLAITCIFKGVSCSQTSQALYRQLLPAIFKVAIQTPWIEIYSGKEPPRSISHQVRFHIRHQIVVNSQRFRCTSLILSLDGWYCPLFFLFFAQQTSLGHPITATGFFFKDEIYIHMSNVPLILCGWNCALMKPSQNPLKSDHEKLFWIMKTTYSLLCG